MKYKIISYDDSTHTLVVKYNDNDDQVLNFDIAVKHDGTLLTNEEIYQLLLNAAPISREEKLAIVKESESARIAALVGKEKSFTIYEAIKPPDSLVQPIAAPGQDPLVTDIINAHSIPSVSI